MRISTAGRYGLRIMLDIALHSQDENVPRMRVSERQHVSSDYVAQLTRRLTQAGLLVTQKGPGGGYQLGRQPQHIRVGEIFHALEGPVALAPCLIDDADYDCAGSVDCVTRMVWIKLAYRIDEFLDGMTLQDLVNMRAELLINMEKTKKQKTILADDKVHNQESISSSESSNK